MRQQLQTVSNTGEEIKLNFRWINKGQLIQEQTPDSASSKGSKLSIMDGTEKKFQELTFQGNSKSHDLHSKRYPFVRKQNGGSRHFLLKENYNI